MSYKYIFGSKWGLKARKYDVDWLNFLGKGSRESKLTALNLYIMLAHKELGLTFEKNRSSTTHQKNYLTKGILILVKFFLALSRSLFFSENYFVCNLILTELSDNIMTSEY